MFGTGSRHGKAHNHASNGRREGGLAARGAQAQHAGTSHEHGAGNTAEPNPQASKAHAKQGVLGAMKAGRHAHATADPSPTPPRRGYFLRGARRWAARVGVMFMTTLLVLQGAPTVALASVLTNTSAQNQQALSALKSITGDDATAQNYYALMQQYGLLDENGNTVDSWQIQMDGEDVSLDDIRATLKGAYDPDAKVTVDGAEVTLGNLATMLEIEDYVAYVRETYFSDEEEWSEEQLEALRNLQNQVQTTGIQITGANGDVTFPSGIDHSARVSMKLAVGESDAATSATVDAKGGGTVRATFTLTGGTNEKPVSFTVRTLEGSAEEGVDYEAVNQKIELTPEKRTATVDVVVKDRSAALGDKTLLDFETDYWYKNRILFLRADGIENALFEGKKGATDALSARIDIKMDGTGDLAGKLVSYTQDHSINWPWEVGANASYELAPSLRYRLARNMIDSSLTLTPEWAKGSHESFPSTWKTTHVFESVIQSHIYLQQEVKVSAGTDTELYKLGPIGYKLDEMKAAAEKDANVKKRISSHDDMGEYLTGGATVDGVASKEAVKVPLEADERTTLAESGKLNILARQRLLYTDLRISDVNKSTGFTMKASFADTKAPELVGLSVPADVTFGPGDVIPITATFSEPVRTNGAALTLSDGKIISLGEDWPMYEEELWNRYRNKSSFKNGASYETLDEWLYSSDNEGYLGYPTTKDSALRILENCRNSEFGTSQPPYSSRLTFLYTVPDVSNTELSIKGITAKDLLGNALSLSTDDEEHPLPNQYKKLASGQIVAPRKTDALGALTAKVDRTAEGDTLSVSLKVNGDKKLTAWLGSDMENKDGTFASKSLAVSRDGGKTLVPLSLPAGTIEVTGATLGASIPLAMNTGEGVKTHAVELFLEGSPLVGRYATADQQPALFLKEDNLEASVSVTDSEGKPYDYADETHTIYVQDAPNIQASFKLLTSGKLYTWANASKVTTWKTDDKGAYVKEDGKLVPADPDAHFVWGSSDPTVANVNAEGKVTPTGKAGTVSFELTALNGDVVVDGTSKRATKTATYTFAGAPEDNTELTFGAGLTPFLLIPNNKITAAEGQNTQVYWSSNLSDKAQKTDENPDAKTTFTVSVTRGDKKWSDTVTGTAAKPAASATVPGKFLTYDYNNPTNNTFAVTVSAEFEGKPYKAQATIELSAQPAEVTLGELGSYYLRDTDGAVNLSWVVKHLSRSAADAGEDTEGTEGQAPATVADEEGDEGSAEPTPEIPEGTSFELRVTKDGETKDKLHVTSPGTPDAEESGTYKGDVSFTPDPIEAVPSEASSYRDVYTVTVRAKNGEDSTWSYDSFLLYVYDAQALQIVVDGVMGRGDTPNELTMSNRGEFGEGDAGHGDVNSAEWRNWVVGLKRDISLKKVISANYGDYAWTELADQIEWSSSNNDVASVNYQQGTLYEDITKFTYTSYRPTTDFLLSGTKDGETTVTAKHKLAGMTDELPVTVQTMANRLYLFQAYPQVETTLRFKVYTNAEHTEISDDWITTTSDEHGAAAYYAEFGIATDVYLSSKSNDNDYLGTIYNSSLKTGERDSTTLELYPCNNINMRRAAYAYLYLKKPDGTPYAGEVNFRGGVYVNNEYKEKGQFKLQDSSDFVAGNQDNSVTVGADGKLAVTMDQTQWGLEGGAVSATDDVRYVFQIEKENGQEYYPILFSVDGTVNEDTIVDAGEAVVAFRENDLKAPRPFIAAQNVRYSNYGTAQSLLGSTGYVGPSDSCEESIVTTDVMWWGDDKPEDVEGAKNRIALVTSSQQGVATGAGQSSSTNSAYEFSDMLITSYTVRLNKDSMEGLLKSGATSALKLNYYKDGETLSRSESMGFRLSNMLGKGRAEGQTEIRSLLTTMGDAVNTNDPEAKQADMGVEDKFVSKLLELVAGDNYSADTDAGKLFKIKIAPTTDPTKFMGFMTVNVGNMDEGQVSGVYTEAGKNDQFEYTPGLAETMMLTGIKSPFEYAFGQMEDYYKAALHRGVRSTSFDLGGYCESMIYYNAKTGKWEIQVLNGGFNAGGGVSYSWNFNTWCGPVPFTSTITAGGTAEVSMDALAVGWLSEDWQDSGLGNDFLTELRLYLYLRFFAGVGFDYSIVAFKLGVFGQIDFDMQFQWLNRPYLTGGRINSVDKGDDAKLDGQSFKINGRIGLEFLVKLLFLSYEKILYSWDFNFLNKKTGEWNKIQKNWEANSAAQKSAIGDLVANGSASLMSVGGSQVLALNLAPTVESRDYLADGGRTWGSGGWSFFSLDKVSGLKNLETNTYPYANPVVTDDGALVAYLTDQDETDVEKTHVAWGQRNASGSYEKGAGEGLIAGPADATAEDAGYGDAQLALAGTGNFAVATWARQTVSLNKDAGATVSTEDQMMQLNSTDVFASVYNGSAWVTTRLSENSSADLAPVVATNGKSDSEARAVVAWRQVASSGSMTKTDAGSVAGVTNFDQKDTIVYRSYNGSEWSDTQTLYNGTSGSVKGLVAEMLESGEAAVAYTLDKNSDEQTTADRQIAYAVIDAEGEVVRNVEVTSDAYLNENPQLAAVSFPGGDGKDAGQRFVLGWYTEQAAMADSATTLDGGTSAVADTGEAISDIRLLSFDGTGAAGQYLPDSISQVADSYGVSITSDFRFTKNAASINDLSILWTERAELEASEGSDNAGEGSMGTSENPDLSSLKAERDVLKGARFYTYGEKDELVRLTGAARVAEMDKGTLIDHFDAYVSNAEANEVKAVILGTTYGAGGETVTREAETVAGDTVSFKVPKRVSAMYTATEAYTDKISVPSVVADYDSVRTDAETSLQFHVVNEGVHAITGLSIKVGSTTTDYGTAAKGQEPLNLMPGDTLSLYANYNVPEDGVVDPAYEVTASFDEGAGATGSAAVEGEGGLLGFFAADGATAKGTVLLDRPDVSVTAAQITAEAEGKRTIQVKLNNTADAALAGHADRSVRLGFYTDASCETPVASKYLKGIDGSEIADGKLTISDGTSLKMIDEGGYATQVVFDAAQFAADSEAEDGNGTSGKAEIPAEGIKVFVKAEVLQDGAAYGEPDYTNNYATLTCDNLAVRTGEDVSVASDLVVDAENGKATVSVSLRNNRLATTETGNVIVTLLGKNNEVLAEKQSYVQGSEGSGNNGFVKLGGEGSGNETFTFEGGEELDVTEVVDARVTYSDAKLEQDNANLGKVTADGVELNYTEATDEEGGVTRTYSGTASSSLAKTLLTLVPENLDATITVNGKPYEQALEASLQPGMNRFEIVVTAQGSTEENPITNTYLLEITSERSWGGGGGSATYPVTVPEKTAHGTVAVAPESAKAGERVVVTPTPDEGYVVAGVTVTDAEGARLEVAAGADGTYSFEMPEGGATVAVRFACDGGETCPSREFSDVPAGTWYHEAIDWAVTNDLLHGYDGTGRMGPEDKLTRAQIAGILYNAAGSPEADLSVLGRFSDVDAGAWYGTALAWAVSQGLLNGYGTTGRMGPEDTLTREQAAAVLMRWSEQHGGDVSARADLASYPDASSVSDWAQECMAWAVGADIIHGVDRPDGTRSLAPQGSTTRGQFAALMMNMFDGEPLS